MRRRLAKLVATLPLVLPALPAAGHAADGYPNLLLVTVDTLRADHLGVYGHAADISPNIDRLAARGVLFEDVITTIGKTGPAFASLFSSLYPPTHGARRNGVPIRPDVPLLAELLQARGYRTAAFISNWTLRDRLSGLARGFDHYDETFNRSRYTVTGAERDAEAVTAAALDWLAPQSGSAPLFLWVHYSEPHVPYTQHPGHLAPPAPVERRTDGWLKRLKYASEIRFVDHWIGKLLAGTEPHLPPASTFTIFVADHGESLGEHRYWGHGKNVNWPNLDIPMILVGPGLPAGTRIASPASIIDLAPTILELLGVEHQLELEGDSLVGCWRGGERAVRPRFALGDRRTAMGKKGRQRYEDPLAIAMVAHGVKTVYDFADRQLLYFDLEADPGELEPLAEPPLDLVPPLRRRLANWYRDLAKYEAKLERELDPEDVRQLKALGYIAD